MDCIIFHIGDVTIQLGDGVVILTHFDTASEREREGSGVTRRRRGIPLEPLVSEVFKRSLNKLEYLNFFNG